MLVYDITAKKEQELDDKSVAELWLEAFPEDDINAFSSYFQGRLSKAQGIVCLRQQELASMAFALTVKYTELSKLSYRNAVFVVGVASALKWRGYRLASQVMSFIAEQAELSKADFVMLSTYIPDFYTKLGYRSVSCHKLWRLHSKFQTISPDSRVVLAHSCDCKALANCYDKQRKFGWLKRSAEYWQWRFNDAASIYVLKNNNGQILAYAILNKQGECEELGGSDVEAITEVAGRACNSCPFEIADPTLNKKIELDSRFKYVGLGSYQMILPLKDGFAAEYFQNKDCFSCQDNW
ncbi:MAG: GNAT family N-acetyltransferase [Candidatus Bruticola sp.]